MSGLYGSLSIALSALITDQQALETSANNVANVNTPGFSRQRPVLVANDPVVLGRLSFGTGVTLQKFEPPRPNSGTPPESGNAKSGTVGRHAGRPPAGRGHIQRHQLRYWRCDHQILRHPSAAFHRPNQSRAAPRRPYSSRQPGHRFQRRLAQSTDAKQQS